MIDPGEARYVRPWNPLVLFLVGGSGRALVAALRADPSPELPKLNLKKGQEGQLELYFGDLAPDILAGQAQVDAGCVDVSVAELLLKGIQPSTAVEEVDGVTVAE